MRKLCKNYALREKKHYLCAAKCIGTDLYGEIQTMLHRVYHP